jgi:putative restriction endonuclease
VPSELLQLFPPAGQQIRLPRDQSLHPRPEFVARHRERFAGI